MVKKIAALLLTLTAPFTLAASTTVDDAAMIVPATEGSANWAGYVATNGPYTEVGASWIVAQPEVDPKSSLLESEATWVGIGGLFAHDLIQAGTEVFVESGELEYRAWYETLPDLQQTIPLAIRGGDSVTVSVRESAPDVWHISFKNNTSGEKFEFEIPYRSSRSSAEWITEAPSIPVFGALSILPLANFGSVTFTDTYLVADGVRIPAAKSGAKPLTMIKQDGPALATPSDLGPDGFSVTRSEERALSAFDVPSQVLLRLQDEMALPYIFVITMGNGQRFTLIL